MSVSTRQPQQSSGPSYRLRAVIYTAQTLVVSVLLIVPFNDLQGAVAAAFVSALLLFRQVDAHVRELLDQSPRD